MKLSNNIKNNIQVHRENLEEFEHYRTSLEEGQEEGKTVAELIEDCDFESEDFNLGFEQGYIRGMESVLREVEAFEKDGATLDRDTVRTLRALLDYVMESEYKHWQEEDEPEAHAYAYALEVEKAII